MACGLQNWRRTIEQKPYFHVYRSENRF